MVRPPSLSLSPPPHPLPPSLPSPQSYMEDHLKNKNRLEREWEALCSYQAEPSASCVGRGEQNIKRNRSDAVVACESRSGNSCTKVCGPPVPPFVAAERSLLARGHVIMTGTVGRRGMPVGGSESLAVISSNQFRSSNDL